VTALAPEPNFRFMSPFAAASRQRASAARAGGIAPSAFTGATRPIAGILLLIFSTWALSGLDASGKWSMGVGVSLLVLCWARYVGHFLLALALVLPAKGPRVLRSVNMRNQILRGSFMLASTLTSFTTLSHLPQAQATAINFLAPLLVLALAPWLLGEAPRLSRWIAAGTGFAGVLVVVRPGSGLDPVGTVFGLITACLMAGQYITTRRVAVDNPLTTLIWSGAVGSVALTAILPFALPAAQPILSALSAVDWLVLLSTGFWGALGHLLQIQAYRNAPASMLAPFLYTQILSATALGWLVWGQFPDAITWLGIAVICASGIVIAMVEWRGHGKAR
jgi:drug/metabolite transporter (DMT)-like permease